MVSSIAGSLPLELLPGGGHADRLIDLLGPTAAADGFAFPTDQPIYIAEELLTLSVGVGSFGSFTGSSVPALLEADSFLPAVDMELLDPKIAATALAPAHTHPRSSQSSCCLEVLSAKLVPSLVPNLMPKLVPN